MFQSDRLCCVDKKRGDHIHHIDGDVQNSSFDNLAFLCFDCHNEASLKGALRKKLSPKTIVKYRDYHYERIRMQRNLFINRIDHPINNLTDGQLFKAAKDAVIVIEIEKIKIAYFKSSWDSRIEILDRFDTYETHTNTRIAYEVLTFLVRATYETWRNMPTDIVSKIYFIATDYFSPKIDFSDNEEIIQLGSECLRISNNLFFDSVTRLGNLKIITWALLLVKHVYQLSKQRHIELLTDAVNEAYCDFEAEINRPDRKDIENTRAVLGIFKKDLNTTSVSFPNMPESLDRIIEDSAR